MKINSKIVPLSVVVLLLAGCGGKESQFLDGLNKDHGTKICIPDGRLGVTEWKHSGTYYLADKGSNPFAAKAQVKALEKLKQKGYVSTTATRFQGETPFQTVTGYKLTDKGKKYFVWKKGVCIGTRKATDIVNYTAPTAAMGMTVSKVTFKYDVDMNDLVEDLGIGSDLRKGQQGQNLDGNGQAVFSKTNNGWQLEGVDW